MVFHAFSPLPHFHTDKDIKEPHEDKLALLHCVQWSFFICSALDKKTMRTRPHRNVIVFVRMMILIHLWFPLALSWNQFPNVPTQSRNTYSAKQFSLTVHGVWLWNSQSIAVKAFVWLPNSYLLARILIKPLSHSFRITYAIYLSFIVETVQIIATVTKVLGAQHICCPASEYMDQKLLLNAYGQI